MRRLLLLSTVFLFFAIIGLYLGTDFKTIPDAFATGGAFKDTKHGGGIVDGIDFEGVNRALSNPEYPSGIYNFDNPEAGKYQSGECAHCHEPHASFGGDEPPPDNNAANPYLLMKYGSSVTNYSELCWYCHDNLFGGGGPRTGYWNFYQGGGFASDPYQQSSHYKSLSFYWPGATNISPYGESFPRTKRSSSGGNVGSCLNCHTPHGISSSANYSGDVGAAPTTTNYTATNTTPTGLIPRQLIAWEEALCLRCHDRSNASDTQGGVLGPAATDIKSQIDNYLSTSSAGSGHPVRIYFDKHNLNQYNDNSKSPPLSPGWFTVANGNIHAECVDCHNPHVAQGRGSSIGTFPNYGNVFQFSINSANNGGDSFNSNRYDVIGDSTSSPVKLGYPNIGVWGVTVSDLAQGTISGAVNNLTTSNRVYQLCLKCHSYWAWNGSNSGPTVGNAPSWNAPSSVNASTRWTDAYNRGTQTMTNLAWEFATNRVAYHPLFGQGKNRPELGFNGVAGADDVKNPCWCATTIGTETGYTCLKGKGNSTNLTLAAQAAYPDASCQPAYATRTDLTAASPFLNANQTLSQNFVPPWLHTSYITCVDCHEDSAGSSTPRGPHGSARPFILRGLDTNISYSGNGAYTFNYSTIADSNNFCLNCHRADIYGWSANPPSKLDPSRPSNFARQPHYAFDGGNSHKVTQAGQAAPNGIICMRCHGGSRSKLGTIHGNDITTTAAAGCTNCTTSGRLIYASGSTADAAEWLSWVKSSVSTLGSCVKDAGFNPGYCGNQSDGGFDNAATYNY